MPTRRPVRAALLASLTASATLITSLATASADPEVSSGQLRLRSGELDVVVGGEFPRVASYTERASGAVLAGRAQPLDSLVLNGTAYRTTAHTRLRDPGTAGYRLGFPDLPGLSIQASISVRGRVTTFRVDQVSDTEAFRVHTIDIPDHDLVSVRGTDPGAQVAAARIELDRKGNGDRIYPVTAATPADASPQGSAYGIVSTGRLAAAVETNSTYDADGGPGRDDNGRLWRKARKSGDTTEVGLWSGQWTHRARGAAVSDTEPAPWAKVVVGGERNGDGVTDWQDGAIAFREIMWQPQGAEQTKDRVVQRIPFNIASSATHPFLRTLDDTKRINLATDGLGQFVVLKGYQSEGHDAAHPDYGGHYNTRAGGLADLKTLLDKGKRWNADFGVHINATESYPEANAFSETLVDKNNKQWAWMDQSYRINQRRDLTSGDLQGRLRQLRTETGSGLDFLYVDVFRETGWTAERLQREIRQLGWQTTTEWSHRLERESVWTHWATDVDYGGDNVRGINSSIIRFARNHQKDVFVHHPLLMGARIVEFEGWTGEVDYNAFQANVFEQNLPTKYLQHFPVNKLAEHEVRLADGVVVSDSTGKRVITKDGATVYDGGAYLLPWNPQRPDKAYHWNPAGGTSSWQLPDSLARRPVVHLYELTDSGRQHVRALPVRGGKVTIAAKAKTAYLVSAAGPERKAEPGYGEGTPLRDPGFNAGTLSGWKVSGDTGAVKVERNDRGQQEAVVRKGNAVTVAQRVRGLAPGSYAASIMVEVQPGATRRATVSATAHNGQTQQVWLDRSPVTNIVASEEKRGTRSQRVRVFFDVPRGSDSAEFGVTVAAGDAVVRLDDARVVPAARPNAPGTVTSWDFENVDQGFGPFVPGGEIAPTDARTHLAELHAPYTQRGWNGKAIDDVLAGKWSLKSFEYAKHLVYRTTPSTVRFEPGRRYRVAFDYASAADGAYGWVLGSDSATGTATDVQVTTLPKREAPTRHVQEFQAGCSGDAWVGLRKLAETDDGFELSLDNFTVTDLGPGQGC